MSIPRPASVHDDRKRLFDSSSDTGGPAVTRSPIAARTAYHKRKGQRFRTDDEQVIAKNRAFVLPDLKQRERFVLEYRKTSALY